MHALLDLPWVEGVTAIYSSTEQKAIDGADILAHHLGLVAGRREDLGENDRSATGYLPSEEFEEVANVFFANPTVSVRGWETAAHAQQRIVSAISELVRTDRSPGDIAVVAHGGVGTLLLCALAGQEITRSRDQPGSGGGNYFAFTADSREVAHGWRPIDVSPADAGERA